MSATATLDSSPTLPRRAWRARLRAWWQSRLPLTDTLLLTQRNVYILPTRAGWMLAATLGVLLVAAINYQLNLGYLLTFLLAGSAAASMVICHNTLRGLTLQLLPPQPLFAGALAVLDIKLTNARRAPRHASAWPCWRARTGPGPTCQRRARRRCRSASSRRGAACTGCRC